MLLIAILILEIAKVLHGLSDFRHRIRRILTFDRKTASVVVLFENAHQLGEIDRTTSQRGFQTASLREVADRVLRMYMGDMRAECGDSIVRRKSVDNQVPWIKVDR